MRRKSHLFLGQYLARKFLPHISPAEQKSFLLGCVEPDHNPLTYCKGSFRFQWLRGHNYPNSRRYMKTLVHRLERSKRRSLYHYYTLGKLIHYTADSFTFAHNTCFPESLTLHREYEDRLEYYFLRNLTTTHLLPIQEADSLTDLIGRLHSFYCTIPPSPETDTQYILSACTHVMKFMELCSCK